jgi:hypothetical protein
MSDTENLKSSWSTLKTLGAIVLFAIAVGAVVRQVGPTREEFEREREHSRAVTDALKGDATAVKMEQLKLRSSVEGVDAGLHRVEGRLQRMEDKLDTVIESNRGRR